MYQKEYGVNILTRCAQGYTNTQCLDCGKDAQFLIIWETTEQCFLNMRQLLESEGYCCYANHKEGTALFATYIKGSEVLNLSYTPFEMAIKVVREHTRNLPPSADALGESTVVPLLTQVKLSYKANNCVMVYLIRLGDGQFIVIDGGLGEEGEAEHLLKLMEEQNVLEGKPQIAAWFFTHAHNDHFGGFVELMRHFAEKVIVKSIVYNWPHSKKSKGFSDLTSFEEIVAGMKDTKIITARSGQQYFYSDCQIDMLFAPEDLYPAYIPNLNDSSLVFRMILHGHRIMWLGDMQLQSAPFFEQKYSKEVMQSEIMQVAHHGYGGASPILYWLIDPEILFWPCPEYMYATILKSECNRFLRESKKIRRIYVSGVEEVTLDMTEVWNEESV